VPHLEVHPPLLIYFLATFIPQPIVAWNVYLWQEEFRESC
jgi:hypothetical protein